MGIKTILRIMPPYTRTPCVDTWIFGYLRQENGSPVADKPVKVYVEDKLIGTAKTNRAGYWGNVKYHFYGEGRKYRVKAVFEGYYKDGKCIFEPSSHEVVFTIETKPGKVLINRMFPPLPRYLKAEPSGRVAFMLGIYNTNPAVPLDARVWATLLGEKVFDTGRFRLDYRGTYLIKVEFTAPTKLGWYELYIYAGYWWKGKFWVSDQLMIPLMVVRKEEWEMMKYVKWVSLGIIACGIGYGVYGLIKKK